MATNPLSKNQVQSLKHHKYVKYLWMMARGALDNALFPCGGPFWSPPFHPRTKLSMWSDESDIGALQKFNEVNPIRPILQTLYSWPTSIT